MPNKTLEFWYLLKELFLFEQKNIKNEIKQAFGYT